MLLKKLRERFARALLCVLALIGFALALLVSYEAGSLDGKAQAREAVTRAYSKGASSCIDIRLHSA